MQITPAISQLQTLISNVVATPHVLTCLPLQADMTVLKTDIEHNGRVHFYVVTRPSGDVGLRGGNLTAFDMLLTIEGRIAYQGAVTQQMIDDEADAIASMLATNPTLNRTVQGFEAIRLAENKPYAFYNQAVHYARVELEVRVL
jgi:hypothetical protein